MNVLRIIARCVLMLAGAAASPATMAQDAFPSAAAVAADEKAQKQADRTMYWIRVLAQSAAPRPAPAARPATPATLKAPALPERVKVAAATSTRAAPPSSADAVSAIPASMMAAAPAAVGAVAAGLAAPAMVAAQIDLPPLDEAPDPGLIMVESADPEFPAATVRRLRKGEVEVKFEVGPDGNVAAVAVTKTSHQSLNAAAMAAVRQWRFKPTPKGHTAMVDLAFNLDS